MTDGIVLKLAAVEDLAALQQVGSELFDHELKPGRTLEFLEDPRHHMLLAYYNDRIIAMASGVHYVHPDKDPQLFINEVSVLEEFRNKGVARELVRQLWAYGRELNCTEAWLGVDSGNMPARKAYLAAGGKEETPVILVNFK